MSEAFVIMQIGNKDLDQVCDQAIFPAISAAGLEPKRVDRHNEGDLLKSEIIGFLERSDIIVADITNARPNCYLEIGYAMGLGKKKNLILSVREDHRPSSPNYVRGGPRVHFDLEGYEILFWQQHKLDAFRIELERRIKRRLAIVQDAPRGVGPRGALVPAVDTAWRDENRAIALKGLGGVGFSGYWEAVVAIEPKGQWPQQELLNAVEASRIDTFGWPIGIVLPHPEHRPRPTAGGVRAEVAITDPNVRYTHYDFWYLRSNGDFYFLRSLFEDTRSSSPAIYFNTRIVQVTELLLFSARLYSRLGISETTAVRVELTHGGLQGREISATGSRMSSFGRRQEATEGLITTALTVTLSDLEAKLTDCVRDLLSPFFTLFDFFKVSDATYEEIVDQFISGEVT